MSGIKITDLPKTSSPYSGDEDMLFVQSNVVKTNSINSLVGYLTGAVLSATDMTYTGGISAIGRTVVREALVGDVTAPLSSNETTIANNVVTNAKLADMAEATFKGRLSAGPGDPQDLSVSQVQSLVVTSSAVQTALVADTSGAREAMEAQSSAVGFLNRFGRLSSTTAVANGSTPEVGENVYIVNSSVRTSGATISGSPIVTFTSNGFAPLTGSVVSGTGIPSSTTVLSSTITTAVLNANATATNTGLTFTFYHPNPTVVNEALEAAAGTLIYYGANVPTPNHKISMTVWAELRLNASWNGSGTTAQDITFGINATAWNSTLGLGNFLADPKPFHGQVGSTGVVNGNSYTELPSISGDDGTSLFSAQLVGSKFPIRIEINGSENLCRMTVAGRTRTYRDSRYSRMVGTETSGFFVEWGAPDASTQYYWCVHTIAVNAPALEESPTFESGPYGTLLHELQTRGGYPAIPGRPRIMNGVTAFNLHQAPAAGDPLGIVGNPMLGHAPYGMPSPFITSRLTGVIQRNTIALVSSLNASDQMLHQIANMESLASSTGANYAAGAFWKTTYLGRFGATASTNKRIKIVRPEGGFPPAQTRFDSGDLTANGETFILTFYEIRLTAGYRFVTVLEWSDAVGVVKRIHSYNEAASNSLSNQLLVSGTSAGDVIVDFHFTECHPVP